MLFFLLNGAVDAGAVPVALAAPASMPDIVHAIPPGAPVGVWAAAAVLALAIAIAMTSPYWGPALKQWLDNRRAELELRRAELAPAVPPAAAALADPDAIGRAVQEQVLGLVDARLAPVSEQLQRLAEIAERIGQIHETIHGDGKRLGDQGIAVKVDSLWRAGGLDASPAEPTSPGRTTVPPGTGSLRRPGQ